MTSGSSVDLSSWSTCMLFTSLKHLKGFDMMTIIITATREINPTATNVTTKASLLLWWHFLDRTPSSFINLNPRFPLTLIIIFLVNFGIFPVSWLLESMSYVKILSWSENQGFLLKICDLTDEKLPNGQVETMTMKLGMILQRYCRWDSKISATFMALLDFPLLASSARDFQRYQV